ncbi:DsbA family protein [Pantanalinema rosaneae CENA516]|uniref:DsbA family protein n=1 Tax=Pantanalinema rosaneae TaxID=1620701 RepID=UPI003D6DC658
MRRSGFGQQVRALATPGKLIGIVVTIVCVLLGIWLFPLRASSQINPQLKEQVLQIIRENPEVILESVRSYQRKQQQAQEQARQAFLQNLKTNPQAVIAQSPTTGAKPAKTVLLEFSDFQCPFCAKAQPTLKDFMAKHQDRVTLVFKHFPLVSIHPEAMPAAKASWAAGQQGKFWEYHNALFEQQSRLGDALYGEIARSLKLDIAKFDRDRASAAATAAIEQDIALAEQLGVDGTPFFVMNGQAFSGAVQVSELEAALAGTGQER